MSKEVTAAHHEAICGLCGREAYKPYYRVVQGELVEHCAGRMHRPYIARPSNASAFLARFDRARRERHAALRKAGKLTDLDRLELTW